MLRILGHTRSGCDRIGRREALTVGGLSLFGGVTLPNFLRAAEHAAVPSASPQLPVGPAKSVILVNLFGGPPHQDMFDLKPQAPEKIRGEFSPISTSVPGLQICELLPETAKIMDRATLIRTYSHRYNSHNPYNVLTGFDGGSDRENYFAKRTDHPGMGAVLQYLNIGATDIPRYVTMPAFPGYTQSLRRAGPYGGYLGARYDPLFTVCDPKVERESKGDYDPVVAYGQPELPSLDQLPAITADRLDRRKSLLRQIDEQTDQFERSRSSHSMSAFQQQVFRILTGSKTRLAFDLSQEPDSVRECYGRHIWGSSLLIARRLVEAGTTFTTIHWESKGKQHWDLHANNFGMLKSHLPQLDQMIPALILDLEERGLLDSTLVVIMGEMGRTPGVNAKAGRDHWPQCGFSLMFGGGTRSGFVLGRTDAQAAYPVDRPVSAGDLVATIYHQLGVNSQLTVPDLAGRPIPVSHGGEPVHEVIA
jgi:hypothetical protein